MGGHVSVNSQQCPVAKNGQQVRSFAVANVQKVDVLEICCLRRGSDDGLEPAMKNDIMDFVLAESDSSPNLRQTISLGDCSKHSVSLGACSPGKLPKSTSFIGRSTSSTTCSSDKGSMFTSSPFREEAPQTDCSGSSRSERGQENGIVRGRLRSRGCTYEGDLANGIEHGTGMLCWDDGRLYQGQFADGRFNGLGEMSWPDGRRYVGSYQQDRKHGLGTFTWQDGRCYAGEWSNGKKHGFGVYKNAKGRTCQGSWNADQPVAMESGQNPEQHQRHAELQLQLQGQRLERERKQQQQPQQQQQQHEERRSRSVTPTKKSSFLLKPQRPSSPVGFGKGQDEDDPSPKGQVSPSDMTLTLPGSQ
mmetsp:Transcript_33312/g.65663  ORF Transcript_33312/g.65663 Transcript_33312/m.65663 type:complete len:361 (-) Transcript_33312:93-1175(-)